MFVETIIKFPVKLTPRAARILQHVAAAEARRVGATTFIGVEHIFLAILNEGESVPAQVVDRLGYRDAIVTELERVLGSDEYRAPSPGQ